MPLFRYSGIDRTGAPVMGEAEADSAFALVAVLRESGEFVHAVSPLDAPRGFRRNDRPMRLEELNHFTGQLASLSRSGMPLVPALAELAREARGRRLRDVLGDVRRDVEGGRSLEEALARHSNAFPPLYTSLIRMGERTGNLPAVLQQLSAYGQRHLWLRNRLIVAAAYPAFLAIALLLFMGVFVPEVIGQFQNLYHQMGGELPWLTDTVLSIGRGVRAVLLPLAGIAAGAALVSRLLFRIFPPGNGPRALWDAILLSTPAIGPIYRTVASARFFRALGVLLENGAPIVESLYLAGLASGSVRFEVASTAAAAQVAQGEPVSAALAGTGVLRRTDAWMLRQGETNGDFAGGLIRLADACDREAEQRQHDSLSALGPCLVAACGILVALAVVACFLPIFQIPTLIHV